MFDYNKDKTKIIMPLNDFANKCGYFYNANFDDETKSTANNGYNCRHEEAEKSSDGVGCCYCWACPLGYPADEEDCEEFGYDYEEDSYIVINNSSIISKVII